MGVCQGPRIFGLDPHLHPTSLLKKWRLEVGTYQRSRCAPLNLEVGLLLVFL
jgi:hypothetical protein